MVALFLIASDQCFGNFLIKKQKRQNWHIFG